MDRRQRELRVAAVEPVLAAGRRGHGESSSRGNAARSAASPTTRRSLPRKPAGSAEGRWAVAATGGAPLSGLGSFSAVAGWGLCFAGVSAWALRERFERAGGVAAIAVGAGVVSGSGVAAGASVASGVAFQAKVGRAASG